MLFNNIPNDIHLPSDKRHKKQSVLGFFSISLLPVPVVSSCPVLSVSPSHPCCSGLTLYKVITLALTFHNYKLLRIISSNVNQCRLVHVNMLL